MIHLSIDATASPASRNSASEHFPTPEKKSPNRPRSGSSIAVAPYPTVSRAYRRHHHVAASRKPKRGVTECYPGKVASRLRVKRNSMVHHNEWKWTVPDRSDQISEH